MSDDDGRPSNFVSAADLAKQKEERMQHYRAQLKEAEDEFRRKKEAAERRKQRELENGTWLAPGLESRLNKDKKKSKSKDKEKDKSEKKRKKEKKRKEKASKKEKKSKKHQSSSSDSDSDASGEWVEAGSGPGDEKAKPKQAPAESAPAKRDDWMIRAPPRDLLFGSDPKAADQNEAEAGKPRAAEVQPGQHSRELNKYWQENGSGLPEHARAKFEAEEAARHAAANEDKPQEKQLSWREKALARLGKPHGQARPAAEAPAGESAASASKVTGLAGAMHAGLKSQMKAPVKAAAPTNAAATWMKAEARATGGAEAASSAPTDQNQNDVGAESEPLPEAVDDNDQAPQPMSLGRETLLKAMADARQQAANENADDSGGEEDEEPITQEQLNKLSAKLMRAELMGDADSAAELKNELESMRAKFDQQKSGASKAATRPVAAAGTKKANERGQKQRSRAEPANSSGSDDNSDAESASGQSDGNAEEIMFSAPDRYGNVRLLADMPARGAEDARAAKRKVVDSHDTDGKRAKYYADDDKHTLMDLVEAERFGDKHDYDYELLKNMRNVNDSYDADIFDANKQKSREDEMKRDRARALAAHQKEQSALSKCQYCFESEHLQKHLVVSVGIKTFLALPATESLAEGHCLIVPMEHVVGTNHLDEDVQDEIKITKKYLTKMFHSLALDVLFIETSMMFKSKRHIVIEAIPVPREMGEVAPMYFKKAMLESMSEWGANRKIIQTQGKCPVPHGFPYFMVEFGTDGGMANVIDDEQKFRPYFGKEIIGGMLDLEPKRWMRPNKESFGQGQKKVMDFHKAWGKYDWTQTLD